jgi:hypothetical protein
MDESMECPHLEILESKRKTPASTMRWIDGVLIHIIGKSGLAKENIEVSVLNHFGTPWQTILLAHLLENIFNDVLFAENQPDECALGLERSALLTAVLIAIDRHC